MASVFAVAIVVTLIVVLVLIYKTDKSNDENYQSLVGSGAIVANGPECAAIGRKIFEKNGSVADAAIAVQLCEGITCPQSMGLGGGFLMTIYIRESGTIETINARERAPSGATEDMYVNNTGASLAGMEYFDSILFQIFLLYIFFTL